MTNGGKHAVYNMFQALCDPGDEVLLPAPDWTSYPEIITLAGGVPVVLPTTEASGFRVSIAQLEAAVTPRTKVLLFVSPSNPTGAVYPPDEVEAIGRWAVERGIWVVTDEIYEHLTYDGHVFSSMPTLVPDSRKPAGRHRRRQDLRDDRVARRLHDRARDVIAAATNLQSHSTSNARRRAGRGARGGVRRPRRGRDDREAFTRRGHLMYELLSKIPGVTCLEPEGASTASPPSSRVSAARSVAAARASLELCEVLLDVAKVAIVPGEAFGAPGWPAVVRVGDDDLGEGVRRIADLLAAEAHGDPAGTFDARNLRHDVSVYRV